MTTAVITAFISATAALLVAVAGYVLTKRAERDAAWRNEKMNHYKEFVASLTGIIKDESTAEGQQRFARASNDILLFAPQSVLKALQLFHNEVGSSNPNQTKERHDALLAKLLFEVRRDLGISPADDPATFEVHLWASGVKTPRKRGDF
ncbi:MAG TPA: hypothetical protein VLC46_28205 [Thermoanaerobaculia bacterium]|jgi:hypothetical protein|nr:hypothetical protein [Thermoanaerobaculia bacterium]